MKNSTNQNGAEIFSVPFFNRLYETDVNLFGNFFRSTLKLDAKIALLNQYLQSKSSENLARLNEILINNYEVAKLPERNREWLEFYTQNSNQKINKYKH